MTSRREFVHQSAVAAAGVALPLPFSEPRWLDALTGAPPPWSFLDLHRQPDSVLVQDATDDRPRSEEHTSELQSHSDLVCRLLLEKKNELVHPQTQSQRHGSLHVAHPPMQL